MQAQQQQHQYQFQYQPAALAARHCCQRLQRSMVGARAAEARRLVQRSANRSSSSSSIYPLKPPQHRRQQQVTAVAGHQLAIALVVATTTVTVAATTATVSCSSAAIGLCWPIWSSVNARRASRVSSWTDCLARRTTSSSTSANSCKGQRDR